MCMCHSRTMNSKNNFLHERCLCIVYSDKTSSFGNYFPIPNVKSVYHGKESFSNLGPRIWNLVPDKLKQLVDMRAFKKDNKVWKPKITYVGYVKLIYQMLVLSKFLSLYLFLKHIQEQSTRNSLMRGLFSVGTKPVYGRTL